MRAFVFHVLLACLALARAEDAGAFEPGSYLLNPVRSSAIAFTVTRAGDDWDLASDDPAFPVQRVHCSSRCPFRSLSEGRVQELFPDFAQRYAMQCIANGAFALCKIMHRPLRQCGDPARKAHETCVIGPQGIAAPMYGLFALFAPQVMPIPVSRAAN